MKPSQMRHICHLAAWWLKHKRFDVFKPWHLRHPGSREASPVEMFTRTSKEGTQDGRCEFSTALLHNNLQGSADRKKKEIKQGKNGRSEQNHCPHAGCLALRVLWLFPSLLVLFKLSPDRLRMRGATPVFQSINSILFLLRDLPEGAVVRTQNDEYYHPGDLPDSSPLIVL